MMASAGVADSANSVVRAIRIREPTTIFIAVLSRSGISIRRGRCWPGHCITKTLDEWGQAFEITILRDERDASLAARGGEKCVVEERRLFLEYPPSFPSGDGRENTAADGEGRAGRREDTATPFK